MDNIFKPVILAMFFFSLIPGISFGQEQYHWRAIASTANTVTYEVYVSGLSPGKQVEIHPKIIYKGLIASKNLGGDLIFLGDQSGYIGSNKVLITGFTGIVPANGTAYIGTIKIEKRDGVGIIVNIDV